MKIIKSISKAKKLESEKQSLIYESTFLTNVVNLNSVEYGKMIFALLQKNVSQDTIPMPFKKSLSINNNFSENDLQTRNFYYISDIHIEYQLQDIIAKIIDKPSEQQECDIVTALSKKIDEMIENVHNNNDILLIGGDVANSIGLSALFYYLLFQKWNGGEIISVLGNHELWDNDPDNFHPRSIEDIILDYRNNLEVNNYLSFGTEPIHHIQSMLLENELYVYYKGVEKYKIPEDDILKSSVEELKTLLSKCTLIILGGLGFSALSSNYNANHGIYGKARSIEEDTFRTNKFRMVYDKIRICAKDKRVIVLTHTPIHNWTNEPCMKNWIYVNGHTHKNTIYVEENVKVLSDNQIGYKPTIWKLHSFTIDTQWYDPFEKYKDGIYKIISNEYKEFNQGRGILCNGCNHKGTIFMLKRNEMYMFLLQSKRSLCLLVGGQRKKLTHDIQYYYDNMLMYNNIINQLLAPYKAVLKEISDEIKRIGGDGRIHGCVVDISYYSHIYVNPFDGKVTAYWAVDMESRNVFDNVQNLIEAEEPDKLNKYLLENQKNTIPIIGTQMSSDENLMLAAVPKWMLGTEIYKPSRAVRSIQYIWDNNVIRFWNDDILQNNSHEALEDKN